MATFILNGVDLSNKVLNYQQVVRPAFAWTELADKRLATQHDYGWTYDQFMTDLSIYMTDAQYTAFLALLGTSVTLATSLDLFCPGHILTGSVGILSVSDDSWIVDNKPNHRVVHVRLKYLGTLQTTGLVSGIQKVIDEGTVQKLTEVPLYAPNLVGTGYYQSTTVPAQQAFSVTVRNWPTGYVAAAIDYILQLRTNPTTVTLATRHNRTSGSAQVQIQSFTFERDQVGRYSLSLEVVVK